MIKFYFHDTPNPRKVALFLEESRLPYEVVPVDLLKGEQHSLESVRALFPQNFPKDGLLAEEPFVKAGKMRFRRVTEFYPAQCQPFLNTWFAK